MDIKMFRDVINNTNLHIHIHLSVSVRDYSWVLSLQAKL